MLFVETPDTHLVVGKQQLLETLNSHASQQPWKLVAQLKPSFINQAEL
jgi:hypothetical protein